MNEKLTIDQKIQIAQIAGRMFEATRAKGASIQLSATLQGSEEEKVFSSLYKIVEKAVTGESGQR